METSSLGRRFYVATRKDRADDANALICALESEGWACTFAWSGEVGSGPEAYARTAVRELMAVKDAEVLIVLLPGGYGTHVEMGVALALGKRVILHAVNQAVLETPYPCVFHYHPGVTLLISAELNIQSILMMVSEGSKGHQL